MDRDIVIENEIERNKNIMIEEKQNEYLTNIFNKAINTALDIGIRAILPEFLDNQVIKLKDNLLEYGIKEGAEKTIIEGINIGKSAIGLFTGDFENISQMQNAIKSGGIIDGISSLLNFTIDKIENAGIISDKIAGSIKTGKDVILDSIQEDIQKTFNKQINGIENLDRNINNWKLYYDNKDFNSMERVFKNIKKEIKELIPIETTLKKARQIENLHMLIKNNGQDFNISEEQLKLTEKFI